MRRLLHRLRYAIQSRQQDDELAEEIAFHRDMKQRELEASGAPESRDAARRALGNELAARQYARDVWLWPWLQELRQDVRFAIRVLRRTPGFAATAILVLGFGIGVNNMLFTILHAHTIRGLPLDAADRILYISTFDERTSDRPVSFLEFQDLKSSVTRFSGIAAFTPAPVALGDIGRAPDRVDAAYVSANAFGALGIQPILGRMFVEDDDRAGAPPVAILGSGVWHTRYGWDSSVLGREILVNGAAVTVIGVMPPRSGFPSTAELWLPLSRVPGIGEQKRDTRTLSVFGRLKNGASASDARAEVESIVARLSREYPESSRGNQARVVPINERMLGRLTDPAWLAFMAFGCVALLISCANVANLMMGRSVHRARELAIRGSLGASRARVARQLLVESAVIAAAGGTLGLAVSLAGVQMFGAAIPANAMPYWFDYTLNPTVFAALAAVSAAAVFLFGLVPSLYASKGDITRVLKAGGRGVVEGRGARRWMTTFTAIELGLAVVMLAYLVLDLRSRDPGVPSDAIVNTPDVVTAVVNLTATGYPTIETRRAFYRRLQERLAALPGIPSAALASALPRGAATEGRLDVEGRARGAGDAAPAVWTIAVAPRYFETLALPLERGRDFVADDSHADATTVIVNRRFADLFFPGEDPIGKRIRVTAPTPGDAPGPWLTIVGVAPSVRQRPLSVPDPVAYLPFERVAPAAVNLLIRTHAGHSAVAALLRQLFLALDPNLPVHRVLNMTQVIDEAEWVGRVSSRTVRFISVIAFAFSIIGLYAVTAHAVAARTNEIGIRMALGARPAHVRRIILRRAGMQVALGLGLGILGTMAWSATFSTGRLDVRLANPEVVAPVAALLAAATIIACLIPMRRAIRLDPVSTLRQE